MNDRYVPALGYSALTALYDPVVRWTTRETHVKGAMLVHASLKSTQRVIDVGCGTGTLAIAAEKQVPGIEVHAVDGDERILRLAEVKARRAQATVHWKRADARQLPYERGSFDCVMSSLFLHHLGPDDKVAALAEMRRVSKDAGRLVLADWSTPSGIFTRAGFLGIRLLDGFETTAGHAQGQLPLWIDAAGWKEVTETDAIDTIWGTLRIYVAKAQLVAGQ